MPKSARLGISYMPKDTAQFWIIFDALVDYIEAGYPEFIKTSIASGTTLTIPAGYQHIVHGDFDIIGDLVLEGELVLL